MVITAIPIFSRVSTGAATYFSTCRDNINAITGSWIIVAVSDVVTQGKAKVFSAVNSNRYPGLQFSDIPCLWVQTTENRGLIYDLPEDPASIEKLLSILTDAAKNATNWESFVKNARRLMTDKKNSTISFNPLEIIQLAIKLIPQMAYLLAALAVVAAIAIISTWHLGTAYTIFGFAVLVMGMIIMMIVVNLAKLAPKYLLLPSIIFLWLAVLTMFFLLSTMVCVAWDMPKGTRALFFPTTAPAISK